MILLKDIYLSTPSIEKRGEKLKKKEFIRGFFQYIPHFYFFQELDILKKKEEKL